MLLLIDKQKFLSKYSTVIFDVEPLGYFVCECVEKKIPKLKIYLLVCVNGEFEFCV